MYGETYGQLPVPATHYVTSTAKLHSVDINPSVANAMSNASFVDRRNRRNGIVYTAGRQSYKDITPQYPEPVYSSEFQKWLIGPQVDFVQNDKWYIAYPAATIAFGTVRNLALSERSPQITTRSTGGPGPMGMNMEAAPRFSRVQTVPRYSTMPPQYPTASQPT